MTMMIPTPHYHAPHECTFTRVFFKIYLTIVVIGTPLYPEGRGNLYFVWCTLLAFVRGESLSSMIYLH